jgi:hypothetical protein
MHTTLSAKYRLLLMIGVVLMFSSWRVNALTPSDELYTKLAPFVVLDKVNVTFPQTWGSGCASVIFRATTLLGNAWFDAIAPYHRTAVGVYSDLGRRPADEGRGLFNRNVAILYASFQVLDSLLPEYNQRWRNMLLSVGLDPDDDSQDPTTPVGIGNLAGQAIVAARTNDGMNQLGNEGGCLYNCLPYANYLDYKPVNTAYELNDPSRWAPYIKTTGNGIFTVQQFVTPQYGVTAPYSYNDASAFQVPPPVESNVDNFAAYKAQADIVLERSAALGDSDELKMRAELFDNKYSGFGGAITNAVKLNRLSLNTYVHYWFMANLAAFDAGIAAWSEKYRHDAVRPYSAIPYLYGDSPVTAWGGVGQGTVDDIPASQWRQYLDVADHPEYPSGSAVYCTAIAQASRRYFGSDSYGWLKEFEPGSSLIEPGITPSAPVSLYFPTWSDWESQCEQARVDGGVHFPASTEVAHLIGHPVGDLVYEFVQRHIDGTLN